jgi:hypothetical protein
MMATPWANSLGVRLSIAHIFAHECGPVGTGLGPLDLKVRGGRSLFGCAAHIPFFCMPPALAPPWPDPPSPDVGVFVEIPIVTDYAFWILAVAYLITAGGTRFSD